jgi:uncharacterized protein YbjT (DUF2867 family)
MSRRSLRIWAAAPVRASSSCCTEGPACAAFRVCPGRAAAAHALPRGGWTTPPSAGFVAVRRLEAIAAVLTEDSHEGKTYDLTGHDAVSWAQLAELASARAGKPVPYRSIDDTEAAARMEAAGIPAPYIPSMLGFYAAYRAGWSGTPSGHIEQLAGRPATPTLDAIAAVLAGTAR